jgi:hypothetical protein
MKLVAQAVAILDPTICSLVRQLCRGHIHPPTSIAARYIIIRNRLVISIVAIFWLMHLPTKEDQQHNVVRRLHGARHDKRHPEMVASS